MMRLMVKETAEARGFKNAKDLADRSGLSYSIVYAMWKGTTRRIDLATLERLCKTLKVGPGVLIHYDPAKDED